MRDAGLSRVQCKALAAFQPSRGLACTPAGLWQAEAGRRYQHSFPMRPCPARFPIYHQSQQTGSLPFSESGSIQFLLPWTLRSSSIEVGHSRPLKILPSIRLEPRASDTRESVNRPCSTSSLLWARMNPKLCPSKYATIGADGQGAESVGTCRYVLGLVLMKAQSGFSFETLGYLPFTSSSHL